MRNLALFAGIQPDLERTVPKLMRRFLEHLRASPSPNLSPISQGTRKWTSPNHGVIKINCDAALGSDKSFIAIVARDWRGELVFAHTSG